MKKISLLVIVLIVILTGFSGCARDEKPVQVQKEKPLVELINNSTYFNDQLTEAMVINMDLKTIHMISLDGSYTSFTSKFVIEENDEKFNYLHIQANPWGSVMDVKIEKISEKSVWATIYGFKQRFIKA